MSVTSGFFNSVNNDRRYSSEQISAIFDGIIEDGVYYNVGSRFAVSAAGGNTIGIESGRAWFEHVWIYNDYSIFVNLSAADVLLDRYDAVVFTIDHSKRAASIDVIPGTAASKPEYPKLQKNSGSIVQYPLAYISRPKASKAIANADIKMVTGTSECPWVTSPLKSISIDEHFSEWKVQFSKWFDNVKDSLSDDVAGNLLRQISVLDSSKPNQNFLDNSYFKNPVNQRKVSGAITLKDGSTIASDGKTVISTSGYFLDRWRLLSGTVTITGDGLLLNGTIAQKLDSPIDGETTASVLTSDGTVVSARYVNGDQEFSITLAGKTAVAAKLERGTVQTLARPQDDKMVLTDIPDYNDELARAMRYYLPIGSSQFYSGIFTSNYTKYYVTIPLPMPMICPAGAKPSVLVKPRALIRLASGGYSWNTLPAKATKNDKGAWKTGAWAVSQISGNSVTLLWTVKASANNKKQKMDSAITAQFKELVLTTERT